MIYFLKSLTAKQANKKLTRDFKNNRGHNKDSKKHKAT